MQMERVYGFSKSMLVRSIVLRCNVLLFSILLFDFHYYVWFVKRTVGNDTDLSLILLLFKFPISNRDICLTIFPINTQIIFLPLTFTKETYVLYVIKSHVVSDEERLWFQTRILLFIVHLTQAMIDGHEYRDHDPWPTHGRVFKGVLCSEMGPNPLLSSRR